MRFHSGTRNILSRFRAAIVVVALAPTLQSPAPAQEGGPKFATVGAAVEAAHSAASDEERLRIYRALGPQAVKSDDDLRVLYTEMKSIHKGYKSKDEQEGRRRGQMVETLAKIVEVSTDAARHKVVAELLEDEWDALPWLYISAWEMDNEVDGLKEGMRMKRLEVLANAAAKGKNELALPLLRKKRKRWGIDGKLAESIIAKIGKQEDFDEFVAEIKSDPKSMVDLGPFGASRVLDRVLKEIADPALTPEQKDRMIYQIPQRVKREELPRVVPLLRHENPKVVETAASTIAHSVSAEDEKLIREMLRHDSRSVRSSALSAMGNAWDERFLPDILGILRGHIDYNFRSRAAFILGEHKVSRAEEALKEAREKDPDPEVREVASGALELLKRGRQK